METITTKEQRDRVQELIQLELLKRGFTAKIIHFEEKEIRNSRYIDFHTESFQTVPVIFKEINISNFSTSVTKVTETREKDGSEYYLIKVWVQVNARYEGFTGGSNGQNLFDISAEFYQDSSQCSWTIR